MLTISSRDNPKLKLARQVRDGRERSLIFVEGVRLAEEALRSGIEIAELFVTPAGLEDPRVAGLTTTAENRSFSVCVVNEPILSQIADTKSTQGVIALCRRPKTDRSSFLKRFSLSNRLPVVVMLHEINNPSNLGAILRTVEAVDAAGVMVSSRSADVFSPKSLRAAMGAAFRLNIMTNASFRESIEWARENELTTTAADVNAPTAYTAIDWKVPRLLVFGSEAHGLSTNELEMIENGLVIPMANGVESLNLAVSCGIVLFEAMRQNQT